MTVCIGVLSGVGTNAPRVFLSSDRMLSAGDIEFEPGRAKVEMLTPSIVALIAGDVTIHTAVANATRIELNRRIDKDPETWIRVEDAADVYRANYVQWRQREIERRVLEPYSLTWGSFLANGAQLEQSLFASISDQIRACSEYFDGRLEAIVAGVDGSMDRTAAHLYGIRGSAVSCEDRLGFVAIGSGQAHASSQLMLHRYSPAASSAEALVLLVLAKRAAQVAPGVGEGTDTFVIGPKLGSADKLRADVEAMVDAALDERAASVRELSDKAIGLVDGGLRRLFEPRIPTDQSAPRELDDDNSPPPAGAAD